MKNKPKRKKIAVWFSCGAASAVAAKKTIERYRKTHEIMVLNTMVDEEGPDNRRFLKDVENWIGQKIVDCRNSKLNHSSAARIWIERRYMAGINGAPCTVELKKKARYEYQDKNHVDWHVLGFTADEQDRHENFVLSELPNVIPVLIEEGITKNDCYRIIQEAGILLPEKYRQGYNNANCTGCPKATSPTYWNHVRKVDPDVFRERAEFSREVGARLVRVKGKRIFLDELDPAAKGRPMKSLPAVDCGVFCRPEDIKKKRASL